MATGRRMYLNGSLTINIRDAMALFAPMFLDDNKRLNITVFRNTYYWLVNVEDDNPSVERLFKLLRTCAGTISNMERNITSSSLDHERTEFTTLCCQAFCICWCILKHGHSRELTSRVQ